VLGVIRTKEQHPVKTAPRRLAIAGVILTLIASACGSSDSSDEDSTDTETVAPEQNAPAEGETPTETDPAATPTEGELAAGDVFVTGSSTVEPISVRVSELALEQSGGALKATVEGPGTGDGFEIFCGGGADITGASRAIKEEEAAACADGGVEFVELKVAIDGLTVITNPANTAVECLDTAALYALTGPEAEGLDNWSGANELAAELGSAYAELPDAPLTVAGPGPESGTYDVYVEFAIADYAEAREQDEATRFDYSSSANDNLIVQAIEGSDTSLGWVGLAYYKAEGDKLKAISIAGEDGTCVAPTDDAVADGTYPFSRDLFIYVNVAKAADNPAVASYVDLYLSEAGLAEVADAGYVNLDDATIASTVEAWAAVAG
jgi:phosphate transport system substrate-binding protein